MIIIFYCGLQSILAKYNSAFIVIMISVVALEVIYMDVHTVKVGSQLLSMHRMNK